MDNKLIKRILQSKGIYIFLGVAVLTAVIFRGRGGGNTGISAEGLDTVQTETAVQTAEPLETTAEITAEAPAVTVPAEAATEPEQTAVTEGPAETAVPQTSAASTQEWAETRLNAAVMYVNTNNIYSRVKPIQGSARVDLLKLDQEVTVVAETDTDYYKTQSGSFIHKDYLSAQKQGERSWQETAVPIAVMYVNADNVYSREKPIQGSTRVNKLSKGQQVTVTAKTDTDYFKLRDGSFVHKDYLEERAAETTTETVTEPAPDVVLSEWSETRLSPAAMYVNTDGVYSREKPIQGSTRVSLLKLDQEVTVVARTDTDYFKTQDGSFIHSDYLTDKKPEAANNPWNETALAPTVMYVNSAGVYSRVNPIQGSARVNSYALNQRVTVTAETDTDYYKTEDGSYIHKDYLSEQQTAEVSLRSYSSAYNQRAQEQWEIDYCDQVFDITNQIRAEYGLAPVQKLDSLSAAAVTRAWESTVYNSHTRPDGTSCFTVLSDYGLNMAERGENLAVWHNTPQKAVNSWMNNAAHRNIILNPNFKYMGVGFYYVANDPKGNYYYWEQLYYAP
ncbi:MAG: CAP domain-containing protein [Firmicutes bacterium]|nr:CAP domain-containing protein [[Eubacterium] siraeum]MCM1486881.1 CAP domain-containing protein [Bacillota bacterium]